MLIKENFDRITENSNDNGHTYISLPFLLEHPSEKIKHGIILKNREDDDIDNISEEKTILLTTEIECETEIQDSKIFSVQKALEGLQFSFLFSGIFFDSLLNRNGNTILLLNPEFFIKKR
jgi:hypothetical protein